MSIFMKNDMKNKILCVCLIHIYNCNKYYVIKFNYNVII